MADQSPKVPTMLHFGELDTHIPMSDVETIKSKQLKSLGAAPCA